MKIQTYYNYSIINTIAIIGLLGIFSSCIDRDYNLLQPESNNGSSNNNNTNYNTDIFSYPYNNETSDITVDVIIEMNRDLELSKEKISIPHLKYNKSWLLLLTQDDCSQSAFCRTWAAINGKAISNSDYYSHSSFDRDRDLYFNIDHLKNKDLPPNVYYLNKTLGSSDGAGNEVRFSFTTTLSAEESFMNMKSSVTPGFTNNYYRFYRQSGLTWNNIYEMINYNTGIAFHDVMANDVNSVDEVLSHYGTAQDIIIKELSGRGVKMLAEPNGNATYIEAAKRFDDIQTMTAQNNQIVDLYPFLVEDNQSKVVWGRVFNDSPEYFKQNIIDQNKKSREARQAICIGVHNTDNGWCDFFRWINDNYGKDGDDSVWFTSQEEYYEYNYNRIHGQAPIIERIDEYRYKISIHLPGGKHFYFPSTTINIAGIGTQDIANIYTDESITGFSYANFEDGIMMNIDCRRFLVERAQFYVNQYLKDKSNASNKTDAIYFVNQLKDSLIKDTLLNQIN